MPEPRYGDALQRPSAAARASFREETSSSICAGSMM
jgi:hypothetical protein